MPAPLTPEPYARDAPQLPVHTRQQLLKRAGIPRGMRVQERGDLGMGRLPVRHGCVV